MKKKNSIISSFVTIAMCASLVAGGTYALFTSESAVNIAVTSATVNVQATIGELTLSSTVGGVTTAGVDGKWVNGGTAKVDGDKITLDKMTPGDTVSFEITVTNYSDVAVKARTVYHAEGELFGDGGLVVDGFGEVQNTGVTLWKTLAAASETGSVVETYSVSITLPEDAGNKYQNKTAAIQFGVEAVQGNAYTGPDAIVTRYEEADLPMRNPEDEFFGVQFPEAPDTVTVEAAWTFKATDTDETIVDSPYKDWICDFVIECDGGDVALGELGLWGKYGFFDLAFANPIELPEGQSLFMLTSVGMPFTYEAICTEVKEFDCGVFRGLAGEQMKNKKITVSLCLINPEVAEDLIEEVASRVENQDKEQDEILLEVMKKENWAKYIGTGVLIANQTSYYFE